MANTGNANATPVTPIRTQDNANPPAKAKAKPPEPQLYEMTDAAGKTRLIEATNPVQAIMHTYRPNCRRVKPLDVAKLLKAGIEIEVATPT